MTTPKQGQTRSQPGEGDGNQPMSLSERGKLGAKTAQQNRAISQGGGQLGRTMSFEHIPQGIQYAQRLQGALDNLYQVAGQGWPAAQTGVTQSSGSTSTTTTGVRRGRKPGSKNKPTSQGGSSATS